MTRAGANCDTRQRTQIFVAALRTSDCRTFRDTLIYSMSSPWYLSYWINCKSCLFRQFLTSRWYAGTKTMDYSSQSIDVGLSLKPLNVNNILSAGMTTVITQVESRRPLYLQEQWVIIMTSSNMVLRKRHLIFAWWFGVTVIHIFKLVCCGADVSCSTCWRLFQPHRRESLASSFTNTQWKQSLLLAYIYSSYNFDTNCAGIYCTPAKNAGAGNPLLLT